MHAKKLTLPLTEKDVRELKAGQRVALTGCLFTGRDAVHKALAAGLRPPCDLNNAIIYHCGPVVVSRNDHWEVVAAGPTTSIREEPYMAGLIAKYSLRGVIGKGGMGEKTLAACRTHGCVYMHAVGGAAQILARSVVRVVNVFLREKFGHPEAIWHLQVRDFPALVTMDADGHSLHEEVRRRSAAALEVLKGPV